MLRIVFVSSLVSSRRLEIVIAFTVQNDLAILAVPLLVLAIKNLWAEVVSGLRLAIFPLMN